MNILILADGDWSGAGNALYQAVNEHTEHKARQVAFRPSYLDYPCDVLQPKPGELRDLVEWADVVNIHDGNDHLLPERLPRKPTFVTYHGSQYRQRWPYYNVLDREYPRISTALNLDLAMYGPRWLPRPMPDLRRVRKENRRRGDGLFVVAHAPSNRMIKDTETVLKALEGIDGVALLLIEGKSNADCIEAKAGCDLLIEEFKLGYGTNALENWAMGIPVVAHAFGGILNYMKQQLGALPFVETPLERLRDTVAELANNKQVYDEAAQRGRDYWHRYHHPKKVAGQFIGICEETLNGGNERWQAGQTEEN